MPQQGSKMPLSPRISIYRWRAPMVASLAHRASGLMLILFLLFFLYFFHTVNAKSIAFAQLQLWMHRPVGQLFLLLGGASLIYHWCNGLRFLLLDAGVGDSRHSMRFSATMVLLIGAASLLFMGIWL